MHALTGWFLRNPVAANLLMAFLLFLGAQTALTMRIEGFPRIPSETISITTALPDATPEQIDAQITTRIARALEGVDGVRSLSSRSGDAVSVVTVRKTHRKAMRDLLDTVRLRIDAVTDLPAGAERPVIEAAPFDLPALYLNIHGGADPETLRRVSRDLREKLLARPEISRVQAWGLPPQELRIELDPLRLQALDLTVADIAARIRDGSAQFPAGRLRAEGGAIYLKTDAQARHAPDFAKIALLERADGRDVRLGDVARIEQGPAEHEFLFRFNGAPTVGMEVLVGRKENLLTISRVARDTVDAFAPQLPPEMTATVWGDSSLYIADRLDLLRANGVQGLLLVLLMLSLFLDIRLAFWVAMGIPVAMAGALAVAGSPWLDRSLNDVTTFGLVVALGILVDDAVVVGESVHAWRIRGGDRLDATEAGMREVSTATIFGAATTIAAFAPMLAIENPLARALTGFADVMILALIFSLLESKLILPAHLAQTRIGAEDHSSLARFWNRLRAPVRGALLWVRDRPYRWVLRRALAHRYAVLLLFIAMAALGIGLIVKGQVATVFFPDVPGRVITVSLEMDSRAPFRLTRENLERIERAGAAMSVELAETHALAEPPVRSVFFLVSNAQTAELYAELSPTEARPGLTVAEMVRDWRDRIGALEGAVELTLSGAEDVGGGFRVQLLGKDETALREAGAALRGFLADIEGVANIRESLRGGRPQLTVRLAPEAVGLGVSPESLARQLAQAVGGAEAQRLRRDGREIKVMLRLERAARDAIGDLDALKIRTASGRWLPLTSAAVIEGDYVPGGIARFNGKRVNTVAATVDRAAVAPEELAQAVSEQFAPQLAARWPGVELRMAGELEEIGAIRGGLKRALILAVVLIYVLMATPLKSYWSPLIILSIIPFGFIGAALGHVIMGMPLSVLSLFGMLALAGVVVNDCLVLLTRHRQLCESGRRGRGVVMTAARSRFQAVFLTTATTVIGLAPLLLETSEQAQYLIPAAVSLAFGELFATALTLILVPVLLVIAEDILGLFAAMETSSNRIQIEETR